MSWPGSNPKNGAVPRLAPPTPNHWVVLRVDWSAWVKALFYRLARHGGGRAIEVVVPLLVQADVDLATRERWLERLWEAIQEDEVPYIEHLADFWGDLCVDRDIASGWADRFLPILQRMLNPEETAFGYFRGKDACLSAMLVVQRYED